MHQPETVGRENPGRRLIRSPEFDANHVKFLGDYGVVMTQRNSELGFDLDGYTPKYFARMHETISDHRRSQWRQEVIDGS
jgi:hypothetical protein